jgi:hypothetical protein
MVTKLLMRTFLGLTTCPQKKIATTAWAGGTCNTVEVLNVLLALEADYCQQSGPNQTSSLTIQIVRLFSFEVRSHFWEGRDRNFIYQLKIYQMVIYDWRNERCRKIHRME